MMRLSTIAIVPLTLACATPAFAQFEGPTVLLVSPGRNVSSLAEFIAAAKKSSAPLTFASEGANSDGQKVAETFASKIGFPVVHVPYRGVALAVVDLVAGRIDFGALPVFAAAGQIRGGLLTPLALAAKQRLPDFPDLPTFAELGYPEFVAVVIPGRREAASPESMDRVAGWIPDSRWRGFRNDGREGILLGSIVRVHP
jgi:tripartite-type tricarboxylate transporter receptor subunit TctC